LEEQADAQAVGVEEGTSVVALAEQEKKLDQLQNTLLADLIREEELEEEARAELDQLNNQVNEARTRLRETRVQVEVSARLSTSTYIVISISRRGSPWMPRKPCWQSG